MQTILFPLDQCVSHFLSGALGKLSVNVPKALNTKSWEKSVHIYLADFLILVSEGRQESTSDVFHFRTGITGIVWTMCKLFKDYKYRPSVPRYTESLLVMDSYAGKAIRRCLSNSLPVLCPEWELSSPVVLKPGLWRYSVYNWTQARNEQIRMNIKWRYYYWENKTASWHRAYNVIGSISAHAKQRIMSFYYWLSVVDLFHSLMLHSQ